MSVNETDFTWGQITLHVCGLKHAFVSHQLQTIWKYYIWPEKTNRALNTLGSHYKNVNGCKLDRSQTPNAIV